ncbi:MAG: 4Fe-4S dicluster domain-containing protein, partial [Candidatus Limnocylindria bacterium]
FTILLIGVAAHALFASAELAVPHASTDVRLAVHAMTAGRDARLFWVGGVLLGVAVPLALAAGWWLGLLPVVPALVLAGVSALVGLLAYEDSWIRAGQAVPLS